MTSRSWFTPALIACLVSGMTATLHGADRTSPAATPTASPAASPVASANVTITGNTSYTTEALLAAMPQQLREIQEQGLTPPRADDTAFYVGSFYRKNGYSRVATEYEIRGGALIVRVNEGPRTLLGRIRFAGNRSIAEARLYEYMIGATPERLAKEPETFPYTEAEIAAGADRVRGLYLSEGFLNVKVDTTGTKISADSRSAEVAVRIDEGMRYTFGEVRFTGETTQPRGELITALGHTDVEGEPAKTGRALREEQQRLGNEPAPFKNLPFSPGRANDMQRNLQSHLKARGYFQAEVALEADYTRSKSGAVPVTFVMNPNGLYRFSGVAVKDESEKRRLHESFLATRFAPLRGEIYDPEKVDETYREMLRTGLFSTLRISTVAQADHTVRLEITSAEARQKELGFTLGYGSYEGATAGIRLGDRNIFRSGRPLTLSVDYTQRGLAGELLYVDPWLLDTRFALRAKLFSVAREELGYSKNEYGIRVDLTRKVMPHLELGVFVQQSKAEITESEDSAEIAPARLGPTDYALTSIGVTQLTDFRDNPINPLKGFVLSSALDLGLLDGEPAFTRSTVRLSYYQPLGRMLLALGARGGIISPIVDSIPIDVRFFNGGSTTVRSFPERELGPRDRYDNPLGGEIFTVLNAELNFPLYQGLQGAVFVDAGSLKTDEPIEDPADSDRRDEEVDPSDDLRYAIGLGLRYKLPIGPLRLDYGVNPNPKEGEDVGAFHFSFGFAF